MKSNQNKKKIKKSQKNKDIERILNGDYVPKKVQDINLSGFMNLSLYNRPSIMDYIPYDLVFSLISMKFSRRDYNLFKIVSKTIYNIFKRDSWEEWQQINTQDSTIHKLIIDGYRNFRINGVEHFVVNAKYKKYNNFHVYSLYMDDGYIVTINGNRISYSMFKKNTIINKFEILKNAYPFISRSRPLMVKEQQ